jgi:hypothetical protein
MIRLIIALAAFLASLAAGRHVAPSHEIDSSCYLDYLRVSEAGCCFDGIDQDHDGLVDHQDPDCHGN